MDTNKEEWKDAAAESSAPQKSEENRTYRNDGSTGSEGGRSQRPRIQREYDDRRSSSQKRYSGGYNNQGGGYNQGNSYNQGERNTYNRDRNHSRPYNNEGRNNYGEEGNNEFRPRRPRTDNYSGGDRPYRPRTDYSGDNRGYRPRTDSNSGGEQGGYRPRYNNSNSYGNNYPRQEQGSRNWNSENRSSEGEGGEYRRSYSRSYGDRDGYNSRGSYGDRGGYSNNNDRGGYNNESDRRPYRPRYNNQGGYGNSSSGGGYNRSQQQGYNPNAKYSIKKQIEYRETHIDPEAPIRLNKYLANAGICSRREADEFIQAGVVTVNSVVVTELGTKVKRSDEIKFHDEAINIERKVYVLLNKPKDFVTTVDDPQGRKTVMDLVKNACRERIYPVGRLDRNTTGVLLLTNDGELASKLTHPKFLKKKVYQVTMDRGVNKEDLDKIATGITLEDGDIQADAVGYSDEIDKRQVGIEIHSGKNRIVRRIFESMGYRVLKLDRVLFAGLTKKTLRRGDWRYLTETEVNMLRMGAFE